MGTTGATAPRGIVEWVDDVAAAAASAIGSRPRAALIVALLLAILPAASPPNVAIAVLVPLAALCGALMARTQGRTPQIPIWVLPGGALALFLVHESSAVGELERTGLTLAPVAGVLLAAVGCARRASLPRGVLLVLLGLGLAAVVDGYAGFRVFVLESDVDLAPALWSLAVAALVLLAAHHTWLVALIGSVVVIALAPVLEPEQGLDMTLPLLLLGVVAAGRLAARIGERTDGPVAKAAAARLAEDVGARPFATTSALVFAASSLSAASYVVTDGIDAWYWLFAGEHGLIPDRVWGLWSASRPSVALLGFAVIAHGPLRAAQKGRRAGILVLALVIPVALNAMVVSVWLARSSADPGSDIVGWLGGASLLYYVAAPAIGLLNLRRRRGLEPLDIALYGLAIAAAPLGLLVQDGDLGVYGDWVTTWTGAPWIESYVVPLIWLLLFHGIVRSSLRLRTLLIAAFVGGIASGVTALAVGALQSDLARNVGLMELAQELKITLTWLVAASLVALARLVSTPQESGTAAAL